MENFVEYTLPYRLTAADQVKRAVFVGLPMVLGVFLIMYMGLIGIAACAILSFIAYKLFLSFFFEWEYTLLEDEVRFGKIINKERRKEMLVASIAKTVEYGPLENKPSTDCRVISFLSHQGEEPEYFWLTFTDKGERVCILFQPDERMLEVFDRRTRGKRR